MYLETGGYVGKVSHCKDCNYIGALLVVPDDEMIEVIRVECEREKKGEKGWRKGSEKTSNRVIRLFEFEVYKIHFVLNPSPNEGFLFRSETA